MTNDTKKVALAKVHRNINLLQIEIYVYIFQAQLMSEFIAYPLEALNETYLNLSHAHVSFD